MAILLSLRGREEARRRAGVRGDGKKTDRCASKKGAAAVFPGTGRRCRSSSTQATSFPERYRNGAFIAFHGSWNRAPEPQAGYRVVFQPLANGVASGEFETFANGFAAVPDSTMQPGTAKHRPMGLAQGPLGTLFVTDDAGEDLQDLVRECAAGALTVGWLIG